MLALIRIGLYWIKCILIIHESLVVCCIRGKSLSSDTHQLHAKPLHEYTILAKHSRAAASRPRLSETEPKWFVFET